MASKTYVVDDVDVLVDFLWNEVPIDVLEKAVQKLVDEGLITVYPKNEGRRQQNDKH